MTRERLRAALGQLALPALLLALLAAWGLARAAASGATVAGLPAPFVVVLAVGYVIALALAGAISGVAHYQGHRAYLALLELGLIALVGRATSADVALALLALHAALVGRAAPAPWLMACYLTGAAVTWLLLAPALAGAAIVLVAIALAARQSVVTQRDRVLAAATRVGQLEWTVDAWRRNTLRARAAAPGSGGAGDVLNWINLTAGLTHSIGNEVLAFDHYSAVVLDYIAAEPVPKRVEEAVRFIHDTNRARMGFINFLQEFAEIMKLSGEERQVPVGLRAIDLPKLIHRVREQVGRFESHELDPDDPDPQVQRQRRKNLELELIVHAETPEARSLAAGRQPVLEFICYEFIKNSLRNCSGERRLKVVLGRRDGQVAIQFVNDLDIEEKRPVPGRAGLRCSRCQSPSPRLLWLKNSDYLDAFCDGCLREKVEENLAHCWDPGRTSQGGKGLGLFVIRHFLTEYYFGNATASVLNWPTYEVCFEVAIPDDLGAAIAAYNAAVGQARTRHALDRGARA